MISIEKLYFTNKNKLNWNDVEKNIKKFVGMNFINEKYNKKINIDNKSVDEMSHSKYNMRLKGKLRLIKANLSMCIDKVLCDMENERWKEDINSKHKNVAKNGWYRYDIHFTYPTRDEIGNFIGEQEYRGTVVVRCADDNNLYLYDIIDIKK